jgi:hypothetical protein
MIYMQEIQLIFVKQGIVRKQLDVFQLKGKHVEECKLNSTPH